MSKSPVKFRSLAFEQQGFTLEGEPACRGLAPAFDYDAPYETQRAAVRVCGGCAIREDCLKTALKNQCSGVWGGEFVSNGVVRRDLRPGRTRAA